MSILGDGGLVEEFTPPEEAEHAAAHHLLKPLDVPGAGITRLVEMVQAIGIFREEAVEKDQVEVEVGIQRRAEAVEKEAAFVSSPTSFISSA